MSVSFSDITIGETFHVGDGAHASIKRIDHGVLYLSSRNFKDGKLDVSKVYYISEEDYQRHFKASSKSLTRIQPGDVALSIIGTIGEPYLVKPTDRFGLSSAVAFLRPKDGSAIPAYLYYWLRGPEFQNAVYAIKGGVAQGYVSLEMIRSLPFRRFSLPQQRKIAAILSAYDDLIENNLRRIKSLEEMAQNLYREWFVKFRFPGHEQVRMVDSPLGKIPEGWAVRTVADTFQILGGGTPSKKASEYWEGGSVNWYAPTDLTSSGSMFMERSGTQITELGLKKSSAKLFPPFSVMMTSRATLGVISINTTEAATNQGFITCVPNSGFPLYALYHWLKENIEYFISLGTGATFKEITKGVFKTIELAVPPRDVTSQFEEMVGSLAQQILNLQQRARNLRQTRDLLLPKLISGELDVSHLDIEIEGQAA